MVFVDAPNILCPYDTDGPDNMARMEAVGKTLGRTLRGWYWLKSADPEVVCGLDTSIDMLQSVLDNQGPFDGVLGFSQGALMAAVLCSLLETRDEKMSSDWTHPPFKFAVLASGYKLQDPKWTPLYARGIETPSLHIYGVLDPMIRVSRSAELRDVFVQPQEFGFLGTE
ncbi:hypothetical protein GGF46_003933 [Coemansia sp. RSA 552]|nr:hypothetical protein GGF46_003933 [Coemansia sp. RSA 552]